MIAIMLEPGRLYFQSVEAEKQRDEKQRDEKQRDEKQRDEKQRDEKIKRRLSEQMGLVRGMVARWRSCLRPVSDIVAMLDGQLQAAEMAGQNVEADQVYWRRKAQALRELITEVEAEAAEAEIKKRLEEREQFFRQAIERWKACGFTPEEISRRLEMHARFALRMSAGDPYFSRKADMLRELKAEIEVEAAKEEAAKCPAVSLKELARTIVNLTPEQVAALNVAIKLESLKS